ncbi:hypothetical protein AB0K60_27180 [Thermopolyspora sp. NPDC052614]|uniref:hypothetical protein n=1 Tax=Thermopolyspora sp. NPDC052614 TaxID=3155682 RepID=UPI00341A4309
MTETLTPVVPFDMTVAMRTAPRIVGVGTAVPAHSYSQRELLDIFGIKDPKIRSLFLSSAIDRRYLQLPPEDGAGGRRIESQGELLRKHREQGVDMGSRALLGCLKQIGADIADVRYLVCVTSTGFLTPGFSAFSSENWGCGPTRPGSTSSAWAATPG